MRRSAFLAGAVVLGFLASVAPAGGQQAATTPLDLSSGGAALRPTEVVAARVRTVLRDHQDGEAWQELAGAIPELAVTGGADVEATFEAARLAEEMVTSQPAAPPTPTSGPAAGSPMLSGIRSLDFEAIAQLVALALGFFALVTVARGNLQPRATTGPVGGGAARLREARQLAANGVPLFEISRRTGLARDALTVILSRSAR